MKKIISIASLALLLAGLGLAYYAYASHLPTYSRSVAESALLDQTEEFLLQPTGADILAPAELSEHKWESIQLQVRTLSEYTYTESLTLALPGGFFLLSNPDQRDKEIAGFRTKVDSVMSGINKESKGCRKSSIYAPLIEETNRVAATSADIKRVLIYSDVSENTTVFSVYRDKDRALLAKHPEKVRALLAQYGTPRNLHGVQICILYKPKNDRDNENFTLMSGFYKKLFEDAGARVFIGANMVTDNK